MPSTFIDSTTAVISFLDALPDGRGQPPSLYIDLEGNNLSRKGTLSLLTVLVQPQGKIYLIDVTKLGKTAFETRAANGQSLKNMLESEAVCKVFFDVRRDSDALFAHFGVRLQNVEDLQLLEFASRLCKNRFLNGLGKCITEDLPLSTTERLECQRIKDRGLRLFSPKHGGSYAVFVARPLSSEILQYCEHDVVYMPRLREQYIHRLCDAWYVKVKEQTAKRIRDSQSPTWQPDGQNMALSPVQWIGWQPPVSERQKRTLFQSASTAATPTPSFNGMSPPLTVNRSNDINELISSMKLEHEEDDSSSEDEIDENDFQTVDGYYGRSMYMRGDYDNRSAEDFAACNRECGHCGHCPY